MDSAASQAGLDDFLGTPQPGFFARRRRWLYAAAVALLVIVAGVALFRGDGKRPAYATVEVVRGDLEVRISATGNLAPTNEVEVGSELSGLVEAVLVDVNDRVTRGQPIARLDTLRLRDTI